MLDFQQVAYALIMLILISFLFSFWLIVIWIGLIHSYIYLQEWKKARSEEKKERKQQKDFFAHVEDLKSDFK